MPTKQEAINYISEIAKQNILTKQEVLNAYNSQSNVIEIKDKKKNNIAEILYYIGGAIVFLGITILVGQNWSALPFITKILITLGSGITAYIVGYVFNSNTATQKISAAFYLISALLIPLGINVTLYLTKIDIENAGIQALIALACLLLYLFSYFYNKKNIFAFFSIIFATWLFFNVVGYISESTNTQNVLSRDLHVLLITGLSYLFLSYSFSNTTLNSLKGFLNGFGIFFVLVSTIFLTETNFTYGYLYIIAYPFILAATIYLSVYLKSKAFLVWGTIFMVIYIFRITAEFFAESFGWPITLVLLGLVMIAIGYMTISVNKKIK